MIAKRRHILNSQMVGTAIMRDFKYRGKLNRMWKRGKITIADIIDVLYKNYKHIIEKQKHDTPDKILSATLDKLFEEKIS